MIINEILVACQKSFLFISISSEGYPQLVAWVCHPIVSLLTFVSAYRKQESTETALLTVVNDIFYNLNRRDVT